MPITSGVFRVMAGLLEMDAIAIKENGSHILESIPRQGNMCFFITPKVDMVIGFLEVSALNYNEKRRLKSLRF